MDYVKVEFVLEPLNPAREVLYADLGLLGYESIVDTENGVEAYIQKVDFKEDQLDDLMVKDIPGLIMTSSIEIIEQKNWNAAWEGQFHPIHINETCVIRAPFHESTHLDHEVIISPKMSFGTGHHETTFLMSQALFEHSLIGKSLMDMGCGTGVLAILAKKLGADRVEGIDIEEWAYENSVENARENNVATIQFFHGDVEALKGKRFDVIMANINRNILLQDMSVYAQCLNESGKLYLSGFYQTDVELITESGKKNGLNFVHSKNKNGWAMVQLSK